MNNLQENELKFKQIVSANIHRAGINNLMNWLDTTDFYNAPSSTRYHGAEPGGLCAHCIKVYECLKRKQEDETDESIAIAALFHDLCKVDYYKQSLRNVKDENGKWIQVPFYEINERSIPMGHGEKSMYLVMKHMSLTDDEALAIRWHMGFSVLEPFYEKPSFTRSLEASKLVLKLHTADTESSFWHKA